MVKNKLIVINKNNKNKLVKLKYSITLNIIFVADIAKIIEQNEYFIRKPK